MENTQESIRMGLTARAVTLGLAVVATSFIFTSTAVVFTAGAGERPVTAQVVAHAPASSVHGV